MLAARAVIRQAATIACTVILCRACTRHAAQVGLELRELVDLVLQGIGLLGELQELFLLDVVDLAQFADLRGTVLVGKRAVDRVAEGADKEKRAGRHRGQAELEDARRQADALRRAIVIGNQLDCVDCLLLLGLGLLLFLCRSIAL